ITYSSMIVLVKMLIVGPYMYEFGFRLHFFNGSCIKKTFQAWRMWKDRRLHELVDGSLGHGYDIAEVAMYAQVALLCAQEDPVDRPAMTDVAAMLTSESMSLPTEPKEPSALSEGGAGEDTYINRSSRTIDITITSSATVLTRVRLIIDQEV
uniref:Serine-threonine/tyrosine-protein kinase catalytic domain-containing protein n=2 Tax=Aegilops tauschii subsp. strangulata TaxID=200361 RepID=A0A453SS15_AEGTS